MMLDGRTALSFEVFGPEGSPPDRLRDVLRWNDDGLIASWCRVVEPLPTQRDWLQLLSNGRVGSLEPLLHPQVAILSLDGRTPQVARGASEAAALIGPIAKRMQGRVLHIGRTRELGSWKWPGELAPPEGAAVPPPPPAGASRRKTAARPLVVLQACMIGSWRPLGAPWYGEEVVVLRETAEWRGRLVTQLVWERLPHDHPQAVPVLRRWRARRRRAQAAAAAAAARPPARLASRPEMDLSIGPQLRSWDGARECRKKAPGGAAAPQRPSLEVG